MRSLILFLFGSMAIFAQPFSAGIKAGIPLSDFLTASENGTFTYNAPTQRYIVGGMAEVRLPMGFGVEFDALYRRLSYSSIGGQAGVTTTSSTTGSNWEFPLLLKYRFHFPIVRPYVEAGAAWDTLTGLKQTVSQLSSTPVTSSSAPAELAKNTTMGFVVGGGIDIHVVVLHISPEIRFTRWNNEQIAGGIGGVGGIHSNQNQAEFLVGFTF